MMGLGKALFNQDIFAFLCFSLAFLVFLRWLLHRFNKPKWPVTILLGLCAFFTYTAMIHRPLTSFWKHGHWATFHYFMGSKYFDELEYYRLYRFCALADEETGLNGLKSVRRIRHLENYEVRPKKVELALARKELPIYFTAERWEEFKKDWKAIYRRASRNRWGEMLTDRGFNPPPFWNVIPGWVAQYVMVKDKKPYMIVRNFDIFLLTVSLVLVAVFVGLDIAFIVFCFIMLADFNRGHQLGTYFQFIWLSSMVAAMALYRAKKNKLSAISWAASTMVRMFPVYFMIGPGVSGLRKLVKNRKIPKKETVLLVTFGICCVVFLLLGMTQGQGLSTTKEFFENITMHAEHQQFDGNKFGLKRSLAVDLKNPWQAMGNHPFRSKNFANNKNIHRFLWVVLISLGLAIMLKKVDDDDWVVPAGFILLFAMMVISRYYYLALIVFLIPPKTKKLLGPATLIAVLIFFIHGLFYFLPKRVLGNQATFTACNYGYLATFIIFPSYLLIRQVLIDRKLKKESIPPPTESQPESETV